MTTATQPNNAPNGGTLDSAIDDVFGPMSTAGGDENDEADAGDLDTSDDQGDGAAQRQTQEGGSDDDPAGLLNGLADPLKGPPQRDAQGRIIDKDGKVIAATRDERREMYNFNRLRIAADKISKHRDVLLQENQQLRSIKEMPGRLGLNLDQVSEAMEFRAKLDRDPVATVRDIVARVMANGYTMEQLFGADAPGYINSQIIKGELDAKLRPLNERLATEDREGRIRDSAQRAMNDFLEQHEYADLHGDAIAHIVGTNEGMTPEKAYYELRLWTQANGFDFSKDLHEQVVARLEAQQNGGGNQQQQPQRRAAPSTPGGLRTPNGVPQTSVRENAYAAPDASYRDIVAGAFREFANGAPR
jgi:hypothetical protein